jgi:hypothetical protein
MVNVASRPLQLFSQEKLEEFRDMSLKARLVWLEEANRLAMKVLGLQRRAELDERFQLPISSYAGTLKLADEEAEIKKMRDEWERF